MARGRRLTFKQWKAQGYHVVKGEKATGRNAEGVATFNEEQVYPNGPYGDEDYDADEQIADYIYDIGDR